MKRIEYSEDFNRIWNAFDPMFGEKGGKKKAFEAFKALDCNGEDVEYIISCINKQTEVKRKQLKTGAFCENFQHIERYLRNRRFEDEESGSITPQRGGTSIDRVREAIAAKNRA